jgi:uncharacterized membrane protein
MDMNASTDDLPASSEFTAIWAAYALYGLGAFMGWPTLIGVLVCLVKRDAPESGFISAHHTWLVRTFLWSLLAFGVGVGIILVGTWPVVGEALRAAQQSGDWTGDWSMNLHWDAIFLTAGMAMLGALVLFANWCWYVYRLIFGVVRLSANRAV